MAGKPLETPDPIDIHVGSRLRFYRRAANMTQTALGEALGLTFQQIQKYEKATNRLSASMMLRAADCLGIEPSDLFEGLHRSNSASAPSPAGGATLAALSEYARDLAPLISMPARKRRALLRLIASFAEDPPSDPLDSQ